MTSSLTLQAATQTVNVDGISYAYRQFGATNGTPLLCLQHFTGTLDLWDPAVFDVLAASRPIILFENAGVGSSGGETPDTVAAMAEHAVSFLKALRFEKVDILGFSLGGFLAQHIALHHPELVRRIILSGTGPEGGEGTSMNRPEPMSIITNGAMAMPEKLKKLFFPHDELGQSEAASYLARVAQRTADIDKAATGQVAMQQLKAMATWEATKGDEFGDLARIKHPVLVTNGDNDIMIPTANSFTLKKHLPNATLIVYPNSGHGALYQHAKAYVDHVSSFLR